MEKDDRLSQIVNRDIVMYINNIQPMCSGKLGELQKESWDNKIPIIDKETARFLSTLLSIYKPKKILEIGCAVGFSSSLMSQYIEDGGHITTIDRFDIMINKAKNNFKKLDVEEKITLLEGDARVILKELSCEYDMVFLDAAKGQYINIINDCLRLLKKGGILIADDIFQNGLITKNIEDIPKRQRTIHRRLNDFLYKMSNNNGLESSLIPIGDGLLLSHKIKENVKIEVNNNEE